MISSIKQMFCKHDFETVYIARDAVNVGGILEVVDLQEVKKCKKCGKIIK